jgi:hypothetical protein
MSYAVSGWHRLCSVAGLAQVMLRARVCVPYGATAGLVVKFYRSKRIDEINC